MRSLDRQRGESSPPSWFILAVVFLSVMGWGAEKLFAAEADRLEVAVEPGGGVRATAQVFFPRGRMLSKRCWLITLIGLTFLKSECAWPN